MRLVRLASPLLALALGLAAGDYGLGGDLAPLGSIRGAAAATIVLPPPPSTAARQVGRWRLTDGSGTTATDSGPWGLHGTLVDSESGDWVADPFDLPGAYALDLDGTNDHVSLPAGVGLEGATSATVCAWIKMDVIAAIYIVNIETSSSGYARLALALSSDGKIEIRWRNSAADPSGSVVLRKGATVIAVNTPTHVCGVWDSVADTVAAYVNGALDTNWSVASVELGTSASTAAYIGRRLTTYMNGAVADVRIWASFTGSGGALSAAEIAAIYAGRG
jgi:hypothetical protein